MPLILRFLSSLKLGLVLISLLALSCIAGSLVAANDSMGVDHGRAYVFHTPWFLGLMGLLLVNLCLCSWEKSYIALTLYKKKNPIATPRFYEKAVHAFIVPWRGSMDSIMVLLRRNYTTAFRRGNSFYVQKGLIGRTGATIIHIGLLWTMTAGFYRILADDFGWGIFDSTVILPEGASTDSYYTRIDRLKKPEADNLRENKMPFSVRCLDFTAEYHPHSTVARKFASLVEVTDGDYQQIGEVTMQEPMLYKGYKITQNSFSPNDMVQRGRFRIVDTSSGQSAEFDAGAGDPVKVPLPDAAHLFFQANALAPEASYHIMDLAGRKVLQEGTVAGRAARTAAMPVDLAPMQSELADSRYSFLVAALFPNFTFDEEKRPTTKDENFSNPAVLVMLFKNGKPNGYAWLFHNADAQSIVGQPHPEVAIQFVQYRVREGSDGSKGLFDYEVELKISEKQSGKDLGSFWTAAGKVTEVPGIDEAILRAPNVTTEERSHGATADPHHTHDAHQHGSESASPHNHNHDHDHQHNPSSGSGESTASAVHGGAAQTESPAGGIVSAAPTESPRYEITWLGPTSGHVTYLGFMQDPSVGWLFTGCMIVVLGTLVAFVISYREAWIWYDEEKGLLYMATSVRGTSPGAHREFDRIAAQLIALNEDPQSLKVEEEELVSPS